MRFSTTRLFPLGLMFVLALLTFWLDRATREEPMHPSLRRHDPDYVIANLTATSFDRAGRAETVVSAAQMRHYPDDDSNDLVMPQVVQDKPNEPRISVRADRGLLAREGDELFLYDNVLAVREAEPERPAARMTTSFLHLVRDRSLMLTDREVQFVEGGRSLSGRGMEYNNDTRELVLHGDVRARFEPERK